MNKLVILIGKSCVGKDTLSTLVAQKFNLNLLVSTTTRPKRYYEKQHIDYHFTNNVNFEQMIKEDMLLEYRDYDSVMGKWYYGLTKTELESKDGTCIVVLNPYGFAQVKAKYPKELLYPIYVFVGDDKVRLQRMLDRELEIDGTELSRRWLADEEDFQDISEEEFFFVSNDELYNSVDIIGDFLKEKGIL